MVSDTHPMLRRMAMLLLLVLIVSNAANHKTRVAQACVTAGPDPWYVAEIYFDQTTLPVGVTVNENGAATVSIRNASSTPLYFVEDFWNYARFANTELPEMVRPVYKLVQGRMYEYSYSSNQYDLYEQQLSVTWSQLKRFDADIETKIPTEDNRPDSTVLPNDEMFTFTAYYGTQPFQVTGRVHFGLNPDYDSQAGAKGKNVCAGWNSRNRGVYYIYYLVWMAIYIIFPATVVWFLIWLFRHWRQSRSSSKIDKSLRQ